MKEWDWEEIDIGGQTWIRPTEPPPEVNPKVVTRPGPFQIRLFLDGKFWGQLNPYLHPDGRVDPFTFLHVPAGHKVSLKYGITLDGQGYIWRDIPLPLIISNGGNLNFEGMQFH